MSSKDDILRRLAINKRGKFINNKPEVSTADVAKVVDKNTTKEMIRKADAQMTTGKYTRYMTQSHRSETRLLDEDRIRDKALKAKNLKGVLSIAAMSAVGIGSILDISSRLDQSKETTRMVSDQEKKLAQRTSKEAASLKRDSHDYVDVGEIVMEMFNERIGHHKMGNAKFQ
jgi:hypothetical protein